jgi:hypothetical protein
MSEKFNPVKSLKEVRDMSSKLMTDVENELHFIAKELALDNASVENLTKLEAFLKKAERLQGDERFRELQQGLPHSQQIMRAGLRALRFQLNSQKFETIFEEQINKLKTKMENDKYPKDDVKVVDDIFSLKNEMMEPFKQIDRLEKNMGRFSRELRNETKEVYSHYKDKDAEKRIKTLEEHIEASINLDKALYRWLVNIKNHLLKIEELDKELDRLLNELEKMISPAYSKAA